VEQTLPSAAHVGLGFPKPTFGARGHRRTRGPAPASACNGDEWAAEPELTLQLGKSGDDGVSPC
jgi:hypothetical protein